MLKHGDDINFRQINSFLILFFSVNSRYFVFTTYCLYLFITYIIENLYIILNLKFKTYFNLINFMVFNDFSFKDI